MTSSTPAHPLPDPGPIRPPRSRRRLARLPAPLWLASAAEGDRDATLASWPGRPGGLLLLPCGVRWDAVRLPERLGLAVLEALLRDAAEPGPVLHDRDTALVYVLIPPDSGVDWGRKNARARLLSTGCYLAVPSPELGFLNRAVVWAHMPPLPAPTDPRDLAAALDTVAAMPSVAAAA